MSSNLQSYDEQIAKTLIERNLAIEKSLHSTDADEILKAQIYLQKQAKAGEMKSFVFSPEHEFYNNLGYKNHPTNISYQTLRNMARTPHILPIIKTRGNQVANYAEFVEDEQQVGWTIRPKVKPFQKRKDKYSESEKKIMGEIAEFIQNCGNEEEKWNNDTFETFLRKITADSLSLDQSTFEIIQNRRGVPTEFVATDGATFRLAETYDNRPETWGSNQKTQYEEINGYYPSYVQVYNQNTHQIFYPWELCFGIRNTSTSIYNNGYGISELEDMIQVVTFLLYGLQYNGNFFKQGSNPKGILNIKNGAGQNALNELRQVWRSTIAGVNNSHKLPIIEGADLEFINMQSTNKDMEFHQWNDFLMVLACSIFAIDPSELGFNFQGAASMFGQDGQKQRLQHSQTKGLIPILKFHQRNINKYIVERLNKNYEFVFCGIEQEDKIVALDMDVKKVNMGAISMEDIFKKYSGRDFNPEKDTILNPIYQQIQTQKMMGGQDSNDAVDQMTGEQSNDNQDENNPFTKGLNNWIENNILNK